MSIDRVNDLLRPRKVVESTGPRKRSIIQIFDTLPELILELETNRYPKQTPAMATRHDPADTPLPKRKHCVDLLRYLEMAEPVYIQRREKAEETRKPTYPDIGY